jgi:hypothetical protein
VVLVEVSNNVLGLKIPDLNTRVGTSAEPITVGGEDEGVDDISSIEGVEVLALVEVPQHGSAVLSTRGAERTVRGNSDGVDVASVANEVLTELELVGDGPDLDDLVPTGRDNDGIQGLRGELHARDPITVSLLNRILALTKSVPETNGAVTRTRNDLAIVNGEGNRENVLGVTNKAASSSSSLECPEAEGGVP